MAASFPVYPSGILAYFVNKYWYHVISDITENQYFQNFGKEKIKLLTFTESPIFMSGQGSTAESKTKLSLCLIKHYSMKAYGEWML
jgi:hypothetical protein